MASMLGANLDDVLSTRITLTTPKGGEELYLDFQFSPKKVTLQDIFAAARCQWKHKNLVLADPEKFLWDVEAIDWEYVGGDKFDLDDETDKQRQMAKSGVCDGDRLVVLPAADGTCSLYRTKPTPSEEAFNWRFHRVNEFHANVGVELKALPEIEGLCWVIDEKEYDVPLSIVSADLPTVGDVSNAFRSAHQIPPDCKGNLALTAPDGKIWHEYTARDENTLIQELGLLGPVVKVALSNEKYQIILNTMTGKKCTFGVYPFTTVGELKTMVEEEEKIPTDQQRLTFGGQQLEDERTMHDHKILPGATLFILLRLCGGMYHPTSARQDFLNLADADSAQVSITLLFPDGDETNVSVSPWTEVTNLKALAMSTLSCKPRAKKQKVQSERE
jgi:large subunit ribosomal protein L40e